VGQATLQCDARTVIDMRQFIATKLASIRIRGGAGRNPNDPTQPLRNTFVIGVRANFAFRAVTGVAAPRALRAVLIVAVGIARIGNALSRSYRILRTIKYY
jgi:hypothetical protein